MDPREHRNGKERPVKGHDQKLSRCLTKLLRHQAVNEGIQISPDGYVNLELVYGYLTARGFKGVQFKQIRDVVDNNDKKRFELKQDKNKIFIRATQGHSIKQISTEELLNKITDPELYPTVVHGTFRKAWDIIKNTGLNKMGRNHIHFAPGMPQEEGVISGMRGQCDVIIQIDMAMAIKDGINFYISSNNVILTEGIQGVLPPQYFKRVMRRDGKIIKE